MAYKKNPYNMDKIPDFALQPARGVKPDEMPQPSSGDGEKNAFDPAVYEKLLAQVGSVLEPEENQGQEFPMAAGTDSDSEVVLETAAADGAAQEDIQQVMLEEPEVYTVKAGESEEIQDQPTALFEKNKGGVWTPPAVPVEPPADNSETLPVEPVVPEISEPEIPEVPEPQMSEEAVPEIPEAEMPQSPEVPEPIEPAEPIRIETPAEDLPDVLETVPVKPAEPIDIKTPTKIIPVGDEALCSNLKIVNLKQKPQARIFIEEDILVPDVKPDLMSILSMDGKAQLSDREVFTGEMGLNSLKISGDFVLQTLYIPEKSDNGECVVSIESRLPFKEEVEIRGEPLSDIAIYPIVESIEYTVINERKFRVKAALSIYMKEYQTMNVDFFEGVANEDVQMLNKKIRMTDVALRKMESMEIKEELSLKENAPEIERILSYDVTVAENHKQVSWEKAVINASVYYNIMYLGRTRGSDEEEAGILKPVLYQGKTEFTQFIKLGDISSEQPPSGSKTTFSVSGLSVQPAEDDENCRTRLDVSMNVDTYIEVYRDMEREIVTDIYHHQREMQYDVDKIEMMNLCGTSSSEISAREILNTPEVYDGIEEIVYMSGNPVITNSFIEPGRAVCEGVIPLKAVCIAADGNNTPFSIKQDIPFRSSVDIPGAKPGMSVDYDVCLKDLWYDKINNRQVEVNAGAQVCAVVTSQEEHQLIKNVCFAEAADGASRGPSIVLYITREGDNIWKIAKKYRTTIDEIKKINNIDQSGDIKSGTKLLIVK